MGIDLSVGVPEWPSSSAILDFQEGFKLNLSDIYSYPTPINEEESVPVFSVLSDYFSVDFATGFSLSIHNGGRAAIHDILQYVVSSKGAKEIYLQQPCWFGYREILSRIPLALRVIPQYERSDTQKIILVCFPNNPDGQVCIDLEIDEFTTIVIDLVYFSFLDNRGRQSISSFVKRYSSQVLLVFSTSKTCCAPGVRVAYVVSENYENMMRLRALQKESYNLPSNLNRRISTRLWSNKEEISKARELYVDLRVVAESEFAKSDLEYTIVGMFVWVVINEVDAEETISKVRESCGYLGASGVRFGVENGTRWALRMGVNYKDLVMALVKVKQQGAQYEKA